MSLKEKEESLSLRNLWAPTRLRSMPFDPCAATHEIKKKKTKRQDIGFMTFITGCSVLASNFEDLDSVHVLFSSVLMLYMDRFRRGQSSEGLVRVEPGCSTGLF